MAPPPLPPDYSGGKVDSSATMGWINPAPDTASQQTVSPSVHQASDDWGGWGGGGGGGSTPAVKAAENGADPWDSQAGSSDASASKVTVQNAASTNQVIGIFSLLNNTNFQFVEHLVNRKMTIIWKRQIVFELGASKNFNEVFYMKCDSMRQIFKY